jgi:hypothetical protein
MGEGVYDVFISYSRRDATGAAELNEWLHSQGLSTFYDRSELRPGLRWIPALEEMIGRSRAVAILFGEHGIGNTQQYERELALIRQTSDRSFPVIPVLMPGCASPPTGFLQLLTWVDLSKGASVLQQTDSLAVLRSALRGEPIALSEPRASICPYRGLEPFREEDAAFFRGRDKAIEALIAQVRQHPLVVVIGASGSGKSSLVFAGLLPKLREDRPIMWDVVTIRPGKWPLAALFSAFEGAPGKATQTEIDDWLENGAESYRSGDAEKLARIIERRLDAAAERPDRLLIYIDQWEELYAMAPALDDKQYAQHAEDVGKFIALIVAATAGQRARARVVLTVRSDFYNPLIQNPSIGPLLPRQQVNIPPMTEDDIRIAIVAPAKKAGLSFSPPELVDGILSDVGLQEGRLPLLQFALKETWKRREGNLLTAQAYTEAGGVADAIQKTAEDAYRSLTGDQQNAARRVFLRLVTPGEGQEDTRARSPIPEDPQQREIVALFSSSKLRLLITGSERWRETIQGGDGRTSVEVAHEALIRGWKTLREWVDGNREKLRSRAVIVSAMKDWEKKARSDDYLLPAGVQLERGRDLVSDPGDVPVDDMRDYVDCSVKKEMDRRECEKKKALENERRIAKAERREKEAAQTAAIEATARATAETARAAAERQARNAADEAARQARALATTEANLRVTAEQKALVEQNARNDAETAAGNLHRYARNLRNALFAVTAAATIAIAAFGIALRQTNIAKEQTKEKEQQVLETQKAVELADSERTRAEDQTKETQRQLDRANQALAQAINSDLDFSDKQLLLGRTRNALWSLALSNKAVKSDYVSTLAKDPNEMLRAAPGFAQIYRAFGSSEPSSADAERLFNAAVTTLGNAKQYNLEPLTKEVDLLAAGLTDVRAQRAREMVLKLIGQTNDVNVLVALIKAAQALPVKLAESQRQQLIDRLLMQISQPDSFDSVKLLSQALQGLAPKLTWAQAEKALDPMFTRIGSTDDFVTFEALAQALQVLPATLTDAQAQLIVDRILREIYQSNWPGSMGTAPRTLEVLAPKLTGSQAQQALLRMVPQIGGPNHDDEREALVQAAKALAGKLSEAQASQALEPLLIQIRQTTDPEGLLALARALQDLPVKLSTAQAQQALDKIIERISEINGKHLFAFSQLIDAVTALAPKLTKAQAAQVLDAVFDRFDEIGMYDRQVLRALAMALVALPIELGQSKVQEVLEATLGAMKTADDTVLETLADGFRVLAPRLTDAQAAEAVNAILTQIKLEETDSAGLATLAQALQALAFISIIRAGDSLPRRSPCWSARCDTATDFRGRPIQSRSNYNDMRVPRFIP